MASAWLAAKDFVLLPPRMERFIVVFVLVCEKLGPY